MIEHRSFLIARCDKCKTLFGNDDVEFFVFHNMQELSDCLESVGWNLNLVGNKILCAECKAKKQLKKEADKK